MKNFRTLELAIEFYKLTKGIKTPRHLNDQLKRAAASISLNLAEGNAKFSYKEKARIYQIAYGSLRECQAIFDLIELNDKTVQAKAKHLGSCLYRLIESTTIRANNNNSNS